jgi:hypothetical protein
VDAQRLVRRPDRGVRIRLGRQRLQQQADLLAPAGVERFP